ncbi:MAG: ABC transporter substrate-binding protein [Pseudorhodoplanes sp.]
MLKCKSSPRAVMLVAALTLFPAAGYAQESIKIGAPYSLSGRFVSYGAAGKRGVEMCVDNFGGKVGGKKIEVIFRDTQSDAQAAVNSFTQLLEEDKVNYLVGPVATPMAMAGVPAWLRTKALWLVPGATTPLLEEKVGKEPMFFHTFPYAYHYHVSLAKTLRAALGEGKRLAIIYSDDAYGREHLPYAQKYFKEAGFNIVAEELVRAGATDLNPVFSKIRRARPDVVLGLVQTTDGITLTKQAYVQRLGAPYLVGTAYPQLKQWQDATGEAQEGWVGVTTYIPGVKVKADPKYPKLFPDSDAWIADFKKRYNREPEFMDVGAYVTMCMLLIAIENAGGVDDKQKVAEELKKLDVTTMIGRGHFVKSLGGTLNQAFADVIVHQRSGNKDAILFPPELATTKTLQKAAYPK